MKTLSPSLEIKTKYLRRLHLFHSLSEPELSQIADFSYVRTADRGEILFRQGESARELHILVRGTVEIFFLLESGEKKVIHLLSGPSLVAEAALFMGSPWPADAHILSESLLVAIPRDKIIALTAANPELPWRLMGGMFSRLNEFRNTIENLSRKSAVSRVAVYLLTAAPDCPQIILNAPKNKIANYLGLRAETFSRALRVLVNQGAIAMEEEGIRIMNRSLLESILGEQ
ncbi:Crp/Fnr family transcriptional regulator [Myxococcota bacterium]|nr:Crp/Fnr family transcriptional regulator [Myxococcota bacterium]MBU1534889.1 Crp/Fnr family transcriptional regulator [Myxococcota bacterium]